MRFFVYLLMPLLFLMPDAEGKAKEQEPLPYREVEDAFPWKVTTPSFQERKTAKIILKNGLKAYLISDPLAEKSAAALKVKAGSWDDPEDMPGMAHFLEHMLFLGTESHPEESAFDRFLSSNGGLFNAYTASDCTAYLLSIEHTAFKESLNHFSSFFKEPLFNPTGVSRELNAVDQEWAKNLNSDPFRSFYVLKAVANPRHPFSRFSCGSSKTLSHVERKDLQDFFAKNYQANLMSLVIYSPLSLKDQKELAAAHFADIKQSDQSPWSSPEPLFNNDVKGQLIAMQPVTDTRRLSLIWEMPQEIAAKNDTKPADLIGFVLGHEGENSLLQRLKAEGLADKLSAGGSFLASKNLLFTVDISLTEAGLKQKELVIKRVFQTIQRLKESAFPTHVFDEITAMQRINYEYQQRDRAYATVSDYIETLSEEDFSTYPIKALSISSLNQADIQQLASLLTPESAIYSLIAKDEDFTNAQKDPWNDTLYTITPIEESYLKGWAQRDLHPKILLPAKNPFIPTPADLKLENKGKATEEPIQLVDEALGRLYYKKDTSYLVPESFLTLKVYSPLTTPGVAKEAALADLFLKALRDDLSPLLYQAELGGLSLHLSRHADALSFTVSGYSKYTPLLLEEAFQRAKKLKPTPEQFAIYKDALLRRYKNFQQENPLSQSFEAFKAAAHEKYSRESDKIAPLELLSLDDLMAYSQEVLKQGYLEGLFYGSLKEEAALALWQNIHKVLSLDEYPNREPIQVITLKESPHYIEEETPARGNAVLLALQCPDYSFKNHAAIQILSRALDEPFFSALRTKQQTAYMVHNSDLELEEKLFAVFAVQSSTHAGRDLLARFELFLEESQQKLNLKEKDSLDQFNQIKQALISNLRHPPDSLSDQGSLYASLAFYHQNFNWVNQRIQALQELSFDDYVTFSNQLLGKKNGRRLAIIKKGLLSPENALLYQPLPSIEDLKKESSFSKRSFP
ncbi:MAG: hypothetical protein K0S07_1695 [Chlamydiales bacterium]|jgi:insulysin|nr:hypothetical protein [Chlamydiales bacterium]